MLDPEQRTQMEATSLGLRSLPDGSYVYVGTAGERFDALIREDGTVRLLPESPVQIKANSVCAVVVCVHPEGKASGRRGNQVERWSLLAGAAAAVLAASALETDPRDPVTDPIDARQPERAWTQTPQGLSATPASVVAPSSPAPLGGASLRYGYLPSPNRQMMAFLERTFEFRLRLAVEAFQRRCEYAVHNLPLRLLVLASREDLRPRELRQEILHLWDELEVRSVDTPLRDAAAAEVAAAQDHAVVSARQEIVDFVRDRLPRGSGSRSRAGSFVVSMLVVRPTRCSGRTREAPPRAR